MTSTEQEQKRKDFLKEVVDEIRNVPLHDDFYLQAFYTIAKFGLQLKAKQERLFENEDWNNFEHRDELIQKIEDFLEKHIK
ncbi:MAG: hypothetical protein ACFFBC_00180 [Promethearchaeota archaeon]